MNIACLILRSIATTAIKMKVLKFRNAVAGKTYPAWTKTYLSNIYATSHKRQCRDVDAMLP